MSNSEQLKRPLKVTSAVIILYTWIGILIIRSAFKYLPEIEASSLDPTIFKIIIISVILSFITCMIGKGKNWARQVFLVLFIISILGMVLFRSSHIDSFSHNPVLGVWELLERIMLFIGLVLLFQRDSSAWFNKINL